VTANPTKRLLLRTDKSLYLRHEPVRIIVTNVGDEPVDLLNYWIPGPCPDWFRILNEAEKEVYPVIHHYDIWTLYPGGTEVWVWDQKDGYGNLVPTGTYTVETITSLSPQPSSSFRIVDAVGGVYVPVNKLTLLVPNIMSNSAFLIVIALVLLLIKKKR